MNLIHDMCSKSLYIHGTDTWRAEWNKNKHCDGDRLQELVIVTLINNKNKLLWHWLNDAISLKAPICHDGNVFISGGTWDCCYLCQQPITNFNSA